MIIIGNTKQADIPKNTCKKKERKKKLKICMKKEFQDQKECHAKRKEKIK